MSGLMNGDVSEKDLADTCMREKKGSRLETLSHIAPYIMKLFYPSLTRIRRSTTLLR